MNEAQRVCRFLASAGPLANTTVSGQVADEVMLNTSGNIMNRGALYDIVCTRLSPSVFRLSLKRSN